MNRESEETTNKARDEIASETAEVPEPIKKAKKRTRKTRSPRKGIKVKKEKKDNRECNNVRKDERERNDKEEHKVEIEEKKQEYNLDLRKGQESEVLVLSSVLQGPKREEPDIELGTEQKSKIMHKAEGLRIALPSNGGNRQQMEVLAQSPAFPLSTCCAISSSCNFPAPIRSCLQRSLLPQPLPQSLLLLYQIQRTRYSPLILNK